MVCKISIGFHVQLVAVELGWPITWLGYEEILTIFIAWYQTISKAAEKSSPLLCVS